MLVGESGDLDLGLDCEDLLCNGEPGDLPLSLNGEGLSSDLWYCGLRDLDAISC